MLSHNCLSFYVLLILVSHSRIRRRSLPIRSCLNGWNNKPRSCISLIPHSPLLPQPLHPPPLLQSLLIQLVPLQPVQSSLLQLLRRQILHQLRFLSLKPKATTETSIPSRTSWTHWFAGILSIRRNPWRHCWLHILHPLRRPRSLIRIILHLLVPPPPLHPPLLRFHPLLLQCRLRYLSLKSKTNP